MEEFSSEEDNLEIADESSSEESQLSENESDSQTDTDSENEDEEAAQVVLKELEPEVEQANADSMAENGRTSETQKESVPENSSLPATKKPKKKSRKRALQKLANSATKKKRAVVFSDTDVSENQPATEAATKVSEILNNGSKPKTAKKGLPHTANIYKKTRLAKELQPADPSVAKFNLRNLEKAVDAESLKYQFSKFAQLVAAQFDRIDFPLRKRAEVVAWLIKQFQQSGVYAYVDSAVFAAAENLISLEYVDTRDFKLDQKRLKKWALQQPFPGSFYVEMAKEVEDTLSSPEGTQEANKSKSLFSDSHGSESSEVALPETLPSSTPVIPEAAQSDVLSSSDLLMFKNEIRTQLSRLEDKLADIKSGEWLLGNDHFRKMAGSIALLDKTVEKVEKRFNKCLVKQEKHANTLEMIQTDSARLAEKVEKVKNQASTSSLSKIPSKTTKMDLSSEELAEWFSTKVTAAFETPEFNKKVKGIVTNKLQTNLITVTNISESTQYTIKKWAVDAVSDKIEEIMDCNSDKVAKALKKDLQDAVSGNSSGAASDGTYRETVQKALKIIQDQLNTHKTEIEKFSSISTKSTVAALMSILTVKSIFSDFSSAATKVLENLKIWSHLEPSKMEGCTSAARNLLDFQSSKGYLTVKDFELALFGLLTDDSKATFQKLDSEFAFDMNRQEGEARVEPVEEPNELRWSVSQWRDLRQPNPNYQQPNQENENPLDQNITALPEEVSSLQAIFPSFYASVPDNHLN